MATMTAPVPQLLNSAPTGKSGSGGARKAAILLTAIDPETCAELLRGMSEDEVHELTREISRLSSVSDEERQLVLESFAVAIERGNPFSAGGIEFATSVLVAAFGPETGKRMADRVLKSLGNEMYGIDSLQKADPQHLAKVVQREHPQTIALVLSHVGPSQAAKLLGGLPEKVRADVVSRMAVLDQISPEVVNKIAKTLGARLRLLGESSLESYGGVRAAVEVLNRVDSTTSDGILEEISSQDANLGTTIRNLMFVFEDLLKVDVSAMKTLIGKLDRKVLVVALKGCNPKLKAHFTSTMSARAAEMLYEDMEAQGPVRLKDVMEAQQVVVTAARQLESEGVVSLKPSTGDQLVL